MTETLLEEFEPYIDSWMLIPSDGGRFEIEVNGKLIFSKKATRQHANVDDIRDLLREVLASLNST
jgi:selenoprotein W-related protein